MKKDSADMQVVIVGAGPAGITAAYELGKKGIVSQLIEREAQPGGLARTVQYKGYRFDIGGHRFYTKVPEIQQWWEGVLGDEFLTRQRLSRIFYCHHCLNYPLSLGNLLRELGVVFCARAFISYIHARWRPRMPEVSFEDWVINHFGYRLYREFFKSYTEKVWGISCSELGADWASQRIKGLSFMSVLRSLLPSRKPTTIKSLIRQFHYPRLGPGQMWETALQQTPQAQVNYEQTVIRIEHTGNRITHVVAKDSYDRESRYAGDHFLSTMAMKDLIAAMIDVPDMVRDAADHLGYRDFMTVALIVNKPDVNPDNWLYIHDERVMVGRIQNFKNWSPDMVPDAGTSCLGLEYFCNKGDALWSRSDELLIALAREEVETIGLAKAAEITDATVMRVEQAYPVYDAHYQAHVSIVREFLSGFTNLQLMGRNGMHKYNNQDHAMMTAMLAVRNLMGEAHDVWSVNVSGSYGEEA